MNMLKLERRIDELEARREREYKGFLESLSDDQLQLALDGLRAAIRGEPITGPAMAAITGAPDFPRHLRRELTEPELAEINRFIRGDVT
jgi:hypothetical protein